jgi:hypothetical protein
MQASITTQRVTVTLSGPSDWDEWIEIIKTKAMGNKIWEYVDPSTPKDDLPTLQEPTIPRSRDVNPNKATVAQLDANELEELKLLCYDYKRQVAAYERKEAALGNLRSSIQETISRPYLPYTFKCETPYEMLVKLKQRIAPTDRAREVELVNRYNKMKKGPNNQSMDYWLQEWERVYTECKELNLPDVDKDRSLFDFLHAISKVAPEFASVWRVSLQKKRQKGKDLPDLYNLVELFRDDMRLANAQKDISHGAFAATFQGKPIDPKDDKKRKCLCGQEHQFHECPYLIESVRPKDWKPDPDIEKRIEEKMNANPKLRTKIKYVRQEVAEKQKEDREKEQEKDSENQTSSDSEVPTAF